MWSNLLYMLPVLSKLSQYTISEEVKLEGNLGDELDKMFAKYLSNSEIKFLNKPIQARASMSYPSGTSLWTIIDSVMARFHLNIFIDEKREDKIIFWLEESIAWRYR